MPLYAKISAASSGVNQLVAGVTGFRIKVMGYVFMSSGTVNAKFQDGSTDLTGPFPLIAQAGVSAPQAASEGYRPGWFQTSAGNDLNLNLDGAIGVYGHLTYELEASA